VFPLWLNGFAHSRGARLPSPKRGTFGRMNPQQLDIGSVFQRVFVLYQAQFSLLIPAALVLFVPVAILNGLVLSAGGLLASLLVAAISAVATFWYQGMVVQAAQDMVEDGRRDHTVGSLLQSATPFIGPLLLAGLVAGIAIGIGLLLIILPGLYLLTIWAVIAPVIVLERLDAFASFSRSRELVRGNGWPVFGVIAIIFLVQIVISIVIGVILGNSVALAAIGDLITHLLVVPISGLAAAVMYFGLRQTKEGGGAPGTPAPAVAGGPESPIPGAGHAPIPSGPGVPPKAPPPGDLPPSSPPPAPPAGGTPPVTPPPSPGGGPQAPAG
jgi:hypothetical protein